MKTTSYSTIKWALEKNDLFWHIHGLVRWLIFATSIGSHKNRWHKKNTYFFFALFPKRENNWHTICHDILSQSALHLAVAFHNTFFFKWDVTKQSWSLTSIPLPLKFLRYLFSFSLQHFSNFGQIFCCCYSRYQQIIFRHEDPDSFSPANFFCDTSQFFSCEGSITWNTDLGISLFLSN